MRANDRIGSENHFDAKSGHKMQDCNNESKLKVWKFQLCKIKNVYQSEAPYLDTWQPIHILKQEGIHLSGNPFIQMLNMEIKVFR